MISGTFPAIPTGCVKLVAQKQFGNLCSGNLIELLTGPLADLFAETLGDFGWQIVPAYDDDRTWVLKHIEVVLPKSERKKIFTVIDGGKGSND